MPIDLTIAEKGKIFLQYHEMDAEAVVHGLAGGIIAIWGYTGCEHLVIRKRLIDKRKNFG